MTQTSRWLRLVKYILANYGEIVLVSITLVWVIAQFLAALWPSPNSGSTGFAGYLASFQNFLQNTAVGGTMLLILVWLFKLSRRLESLKNPAVEYKSFSNVDDLFYDLYQRTVRDRTITKSLVTRIRVETDQNYQAFPNVGRYYSEVLKRVQNDPSFSLTRIVGTDDWDKIREVCRQWLKETEDRQGFELLRHDPPLAHSMINLALACDSAGPRFAYIVFSPDSTRISAIRISMDSTALESIRSYYESVLIPNSTPLTLDNIDTI